MKSKRLVQSIIVIMALILSLTVVPFSVSGESVAELTDDEMRQVELFCNQWQSLFIDSNEKIQSCQNEDLKQYYIVKTIYNFALDNTAYDYDVRHQKEGCQSGTERFRKSHRIYGAIFGKNSINEYKIYTRSDNDGLTRLDRNKLGNISQGLAVCEGYTELVKYLCNQNDIPCEIISGDYTQDLIDPHAWNVVCLRDNDPESTDKKWFYLDATYGRASYESIYNLVDENGYYLSFLDYYYFLRGTQSKYFKGMAHQQPYKDIEQLDAQQNDYKFWDIPVNCENSWKIVTRRLEKDNTYNLENYCLISPDGNFYKIDQDTMTLVPDEMTMEYDGKSYYYSIKLQDYADAIEYFSFEEQISEVSDDERGYPLAYLINGENINFFFKVEPIDMGLETNIDKVVWGGQIINDSNEIIDIPFKGASIVFSVEVYDKINQKLEEGEHYSAYIVDGDGKVNNHPCDVGTYTIEVNFNNHNKNYKGIYKRQFRIVKADFADVKVNDEPLRHLTYGEDIIKGSSITSIGNITFYAGEGKDYLVTLESPEKQNYGDTGRIKYTALPSSKYFLPGTVLYRTYVIENRRDLTSIFNNVDVKMKFAYTGKEIKPQPELSYKKSGSKMVVLENGVDYDITSYENNVKIGTGYINIKFKNNYTGTARLSFTIVPSGKITVSAKQEYTYTGKEITPSVTVKADYITLVKDRDYKISNPIAKEPGVYLYTITGLGSYKFSSQQIMYVLPDEIKGTIAQCYSDGITLNWNSQGKTCCYEICIYDSAKKSWKLVTTTNSTSYKLKGAYSNGKKVALKSGSSYKIRIRAFYSAQINGEKCKKTGSYKEFIAKYLKTAPSLKKLKKSSTKLSVSWVKYSSAKGYVIEAATDSSFKKNKKTVTVTKSSATSSTISGLKSKTKYFVRVRAYTTSNGVKVYSPYSTVKTIKM